MHHKKYHYLNKCNKSFYFFNFEKILNKNKYIKNKLAASIPSVVGVVMSAALVSSLSTRELNAAAVRDDIPYQTYKDFGSNKGVFQPGAENIPIFNKDGIQIGTLDEVPMPDFSASDIKLRVGTLIAPGYIAGVKHNAGYQDVRFGSASDALYTLVDRNEFASADYHTPRLNKIVTEVAPVQYTDVMKGGATVAKAESFFDSNRYIALYRTGTGTPKLVNSKGLDTPVSIDGNVVPSSSAYNHITGGTVRLPAEVKYNGWAILSHVKNPQSQEANDNYPLSINIASGDSGSPLFAYDALEKKWIVIGYAAQIWSNSTMLVGQSWTIPSYDFTEDKFLEDTAAEIQLNGMDVAKWYSTNANGGASISQKGAHFSAQGKSSNTNIKIALNDGKNLIFTNVDNVQSTIILENNIHQGAGSITFKSDAVVKSNNDSNWQGAGIIVEKDKTVEWQIDGVAGDALHRLGEGTLIISGTGVNKGDLNTGDGVTILAQQADTNGNVQAFNSIRIVSGRPKVVLTDSKQINADNIVWGFRGGELDVNGNDLIFNRIRATDHGAVLNNSSNTTAHIQFNSDKNNYIYHGRITGNIDIANKAQPTQANQSFIIDGSLDLENNQFTKESGALVFQGHAISHAIGSDNKATYLTQSDWENRNFKLKQLNLLNTDFTLGRNATLMGDVFSQNSIIKIGSDNAFVDTNDGDNVDYNESLNTVGIAKDIQKIETGLSVNGNRESKYYGFMALENSDAFVQDYWEGGVQALESKIELIKGKQNWVEPSEFVNSSLDIKESQLTVDAPLKLASSTLNLSDAGQLNGDITAISNSQVNLGDGTNSSAKYDGIIALQDSKAIVKENWSGGVLAENSQIELNKGIHQWNSASTLVDTNVQLMEADLTVSEDLKGNGEFNVGSGNLNFLSRSNGVGNYQFKNINLEQNSNVNIAAGTQSYGDIFAQGLNQITLGEKDGLLQSHYGQMNAASSIVNLVNNNWVNTGDSTVGTLNTTNSTLKFDAPIKGSDQFSTLTLDYLNANNTNFTLGTDAKNSDKILINKKAEGLNNQLEIGLLKNKNVDITKGFDVLLVSAPLETADNLFKAQPILQGFSSLQPQLKTEINENQKEWRLTQVATIANEDVASVANSFMNADYNYFIQDLGSLDQRVGELRSLNGANYGAWGRVKSSEGESDQVEKDKYQHMQLGFDQVIDTKKGQLFAGVTGSMTLGETSNKQYSINSKSYGVGLYGSYIANSGAYIDVLGKYVHHNNDYKLNIENMGETKGNHDSIQLETEVGYRFKPASTIYVEPQIKLVYGHVSEKSFEWVDEQGSPMKMETPSYSMLVGRAGLHIGKFIDTTKNKWQIHMGVDYEKDLATNRQNILTDRINSYYYDHEKDDRVLVSFGSSVNIKDRVSAGLDVERSFGGRYNIKNSINFNLKYSF